MCLDLQRKEKHQNGSEKQGKVDEWLTVALAHAFDSKRFAFGAFLGREP